MKKIKELMNRFYIEMNKEVLNKYDIITVREP